MPSTSKIDLNVKAQLLHSINENSLKVMLPTFFISVVFFAMFWIFLSKYTNAEMLSLRWNLFFWLVVSAVIEFSRYYFVKSYLGKNAHPVRSKEEFKYWSIRLASFYLLSGLRWAYVAWILFFPENALAQGIIYIVLFGTITGMIFTTSMLPMAFYGYSVPIISAVMLKVFTYALDRSNDIFLGVVDGVNIIVLEAIGFCLFTFMLYILVIKILYNARVGNIEAVNLKLQNVDLISKLRDRNKRQTSFLAAASHDLRQPVQALELLVNHLSSTQQRENITIDKIQQSTISLNTLLDSLLDISKLDAKAMKFIKCPVSIVMLFSQMESIFTEKVKKKGLSLTVNSLDKNINTDPDLIFRVVSNLIDNAIKYTEQGGITLSAISVDDTVCVQISDTGIGIPEDKKGTVFEEFKQLNNPENDRSKGIGLGLPICARMAKLLDHKMEFNSQEGKGTTFELFIDETPDMPAKKEEKKVDDIDLAGKVALVIENEKDIRYALGLTLDNLGASVLDAGSSLEAHLVLEHAGKSIDFVICDYRLDDNDDDENGVELLGEMRDMLGYQVPAIILTGNMNYKDIPLGDNMQLLVKPVSADQLKLSIARALAS